MENFSDKSPNKNNAANAANANWCIIAILIAILYPMIGSYKFDRTTAKTHAANHISGKILAIAQALKSVSGKSVDVEYCDRLITMTFVKRSGKMAIWTSDDVEFLEELNSGDTKTFSIGTLSHMGVDIHSIQKFGLNNKTPEGFDLALIVLTDPSVQLSKYNALAVSGSTAYPEFVEAEGQKDGSETTSRSLTQFTYLLPQDVNNTLASAKSVQSKKIDTSSMSKDEKAEYFKQNPQPKTPKPVEPADKPDYMTYRQEHGLIAPDGIWQSQYTKLLTNPIYLCLIYNIVKNGRCLVGFNTPCTELVSKHFESLVATLTSDPDVYQKLTGDRQLAFGSEMLIPLIPDYVDSKIANAISSGAVPSRIQLELTRKTDGAKFVNNEVSLAMRIALQLTETKARPVVAAPSSELVVEKTKRFAVFSVGI